MNTPTLQDALTALAEAREYVKWAHDDAEARHDSPGEFYLDSVQYEIMKNTEALMKRIDDLLAAGHPPPAAWDER